MKGRAQVFKADVDGVAYWHLDVWNGSGAHTICDERGSWAVAFADALAEVGPDTPPEHREAP